MAWTVYRYTDAGAPVLTGQSGSAAALLNAVLVTGYSATSGAGWSRPFSGSGKAVYRSGAGDARMYYRVLDDASLVLGAKEASVRGYESMTSVDSGSKPFPTLVQSAAAAQLVKSATADATPRPWIAAADGRTCVLFTKPSTTSWQGLYFGEIESFMPTTDAYAAVVIGGVVGSAADGVTGNVLPTRLVWQVNYSTVVYTLPPLDGHYICRHHNGTGSAMPFFKWTTSAACNNESSTGSGFGVLGPVNPAGGGIFLAPLQVWYTFGYEVSCRGKLRGVSLLCHRGDSFGELEVFSGVGESFGSNFVAVPAITSAASATLGIVAIETNPNVT